MNIADAMKEFFFKLNGVRPAGSNIADIIRNGASSVQQNNESALTTRVVALETAVDILEGANGVSYEEADGKSFVLNSSTIDSIKRFRITVTDEGTLAATEIVSEPSVGE